MTTRPRTGIGPCFGKGQPAFSHPCTVGASEFGLRPSFGPRPSAFGFACSRAFSLLEVMIAMGIFFMVMFSILAMVSTTLRNARLLQRTDVDASMLAAELSLTNKLSETTDSGDFGDMYRDYTWTREIHEVGTNGLFEVDFTVQHRSGQQKTDTKMSILFFRPESPANRFGPTLR